MKKLGIIVLGLTLLGGCAQSDFASAGIECMSASVVELTVEPQELTRGADEEITVAVILSDPHESIVQVELLAHGAIEVKVLVELGFQSTNMDGNGVYSATLLNPFGSGLAPGNVAVRVVRGSNWDCFDESSGTTSFTLK